MKPIGNQVRQGSLPVYPTTYAQHVVDHAEWKKTRGSGRNPSLPFLGERNPLKALELAKATLEKPDGVIRDRLRQLRQHLPGQQKIVYDFANHIAEHANSELVPQGFVLCAALALHDIKAGVDGYTGKPIVGSLIGQPLVLYQILETMIPAIAEAVFPPDFAANVKQTMKSVSEIKREKWEAAKAAAPKPTIIGDPLTIYTAMRQIADLSFTFYEVMGRYHGFDKPTCGDRRDEGVNPFYHQTTGGLFLEQYYGGPGQIWTPWGQWGCWGGGTGRGEEVMKAFLAAIGEVELFAPVEHTTQGTIGPVYAILKVGDMKLPKPELRARVSYFEYEEANRLWDETAAQYNKK